MTQALAVAWYNLVFSRWARLGVEHAFISPGYRDAPLIAALLQEEKIACHSCFDERAAAYMALGVAKTSQKPAILICTSGTAGANYYPAVIEASKDQLPLLVVTADRPFELIHSGANQVMPQNHLFGQFPRAALSFPEPNEGFLPAQILQYADHLWAKATEPGQQGPVHLNAPLREPLEPEHKNAVLPSAAYEEKISAALKREIMAPLQAQKSLALATVETLGLKLREAERGLFVLGRVADYDTAETIFNLARRLEWPVLSDVTAHRNGVLGHDRLTLDPETKGAQEALDAYAPDVVLHFGRSHLSKWVDRFIATAAPKQYIVVSDSDDIQDQTKQLTQRVYADPQVLARELEAWLKGQPKKSSGEALQILLGQAEKVREAQRALLADAPFTFFSIARTLLGQLPLFSNFLVGNSTAIRAVHTVAQIEAFQTQIYVTRGVSGIEGHVATALGMYHGNERPTVVLLGDIALLHDLNSVFAVKQSLRPVAIVVVNNRGGGIFKKLPIRAFPQLSPYLTTPHQFSFEKVAEAAELAYARCDHEAKLAEAIETFKAHRKSIIIECEMDDEIDNTVQQALHRITLT